MTTFLQITLIGHVLLGLGAVGLSVWLLMGFFKEQIDLRPLKAASLYGFLSFVLSWLAGGYYYVQYYGSTVKPVIKGGDFRWIHSVVMETKEHFFLFLPFLSFVLFIVVWYAGDYVRKDAALRETASFLALVVVVSGVLVTLMGAGISGAFGESSKLTSEAVDDNYISIAINLNE